MNDEMKYKRYLELKEKGNITKKDIAIELGFGDVSRPDRKLNKFIKDYEDKLNGTTHHTTKEIVIKQDIQKDGLPSNLQNFFFDKENIEILMELVEEKKNKVGDHEELEIIDTNLPLRYRKQKNEQRSIRVNNKLFKDFDRTMKKNINFQGMTQSQILNFVFNEAIEKYKS